MVVMDALISIHPKYVDRIVSGEKKYEFRKKIPCRPVERIFVYSTNPQKKIVGWFFLSGYIEGDPSDVWEQSKEFAGVTEFEYQNYFMNYNWSYAIMIEQFHVFKDYIDPWIYGSFFPPQSFLYIEEKGRLYEQLCCLV